MQIGFIGLGRMGKNIVFNLLTKKVKVVAYNRHPAPLKQAAAKGAVIASSLDDLANKLKTPRIIWIMITAGKPVDDVINSIIPYLTQGDIIIDGGNSFFKDSVSRSKKLEKLGINFLDIGTSGGLSGAARGACLTIGGKEKIFKKVEPLLKLVSAKNGYFYAGPAGAGHFVKMVHNGIEYALLQSYGEGFELLKKGTYKLNLAKIADVWNNGSVIRSWIVELAQNALKKDPDLKKFTDKIGGGETGKWCAKTAAENSVPAEMLSRALSARSDKSHRGAFAKQFVNALRYEFGGHRN